MRGFLCFLAFLAYYVVSPTLALHLTGSRMVEIGVAFANAVILLIVGKPLMATLRRYADRLDPVTVLDPPATTSNS